MPFLFSPSVTCFSSHFSPSPFSSFPSPVLFLFILPSPVLVFSCSSFSLWFWNQVYGLLHTKQLLQYSANCCFVFSVFSVCVYCIHVGIPTHVCMSGGVYKAQDCLLYHPWLPTSFIYLLFYFETGFLVEPVAHLLAWLTGHRTSRIHLSLPHSVGIRGIHHHAHFFYGFCGYKLSS